MAERTNVPRRPFVKCVFGRWWRAWRPLVSTHKTKKDNFSPLLEQRQKGLNLHGVILALSKIWVLRVEGRLTMSTSHQMATTWVTSAIPGGRILNPGPSSKVKPPALTSKPVNVWDHYWLHVFFSLVSKFENWKVIFLALNYLWRTSSPNCCFSGNFHFFLTELVFNFASAQNQLPNNTNVDCSAIDYRLCSRITICNYWLFYQYCILAFNLKTLFPNFGLFLSRILQLRLVAIL